jgi:hypothetical protein
MLATNQPRSLVAADRRLEEIGHDVPPRAKLPPRRRDVSVADQLHPITVSIGVDQLVAGLHDDLPGGLWSIVDLPDQVFRTRNAPAATRSPSRHEAMRAASRRG